MSNIKKMLVLGGFAAAVVAASSAAHAARLGTVLEGGREMVKASHIWGPIPQRGGIFGA